VKVFEPLLHHHVQELYSLEAQTLDILPRMIDGVSDPGLAEALRERHKHAGARKCQLTNIATELDITPAGVRGRWVSAFFDRAIIGLYSPVSPGVANAAVVTACQQVTHYGIVGYDRARSYALRLGEVDVARRLEELRGDLEEVDDQLCWIADGHLTADARAGRAPGQSGVGTTCTAFAPTRS